MAVSSWSTSSSSLRFGRNGYDSVRGSPAMTPAYVKAPMGRGVPAAALGGNLSHSSLTESRRKVSCISCEVPQADAGEAHSATGIKIGIVGFGKFGKFLAPALAKYGHRVIETSRSDYSDYCRNHGIQFFRSIDEFCEEQPDIMLTCTSILSTESVLRSIPIHKFKPGTIFADVLSVKQFPRNLFLQRAIVLREKKVHGGLSNPGSLCIVERLVIFGMIIIESS